MSKSYGLFVPGKGKSNLPAPKPSIFNEDSDSDEDGRRNVPTAAQQNVLRHQDIVAQKKALAEDPTVFQYDEVYDEIETTRNESKLARKDIDKKPKYINRLLQTAARRKRENERRIEKQVKKERDEEGEEFKDKEEFVTSAYKKKLEELKELEELEKREEYLETIGDVTKQADLGGFYRHLYEQRLKKPVKSETVTEEVKEGVENTEEIKNNPPVSLKTKADAAKERKYRSRDKSITEHSDSDQDATPSKEKLQHLQSNLDADSDFSIESSDSETEKLTNKEIKQEVTTESAETPLPIEGQIDGDPVKIDEGKIIKNEVLEFEPESKEQTPPPTTKKPKIDIWKKRTVGTVYDDALQKYYARKNARLTAV